MTGIPSFIAADGISPFFSSPSVGDSPPRVGLSLSWFRINNNTDDRLRPHGTVCENNEMKWQMTGQREKKRKKKVFDEKDKDKDILFSCGDVLPDYYIWLLLFASCYARWPKKKKKTLRTNTERKKRKEIKIATTSCTSLAWISPLLSISRNSL